MSRTPYFNYIQRYFPQEQWENANCITTHECSPSRAGYPGSCVGDEGYIDCSGNPTDDMRRSYGPWQVFESCWSPYRNPNSPFTRGQWDQVMDPNVNTWMASVIWSRSGWSAWSTCHGCGICDIPGRTIPHPDGPVFDAPTPAPAPATPSSAPLMMLTGLGLLVGGISLIRKQRS